MNAAHDGSVKIALIEAEPRDVAWIEELVTMGSVPADVADVMASERPDIDGSDIILLGLRSLGDLEREALARLHAGFPRIPLVVLAGEDGSSWAGEAVRLGAQHVFFKSQLTPDKLSSMIRYYAYYCASPVGPSALRQ
ncbi:MAG: hypothetical protein PHS14_09285 [Elusimicrobia bacterium]|nr:hypothetical protein [Elusimicrobiota bacterium]